MRHIVRMSEKFRLRLWLEENLILDCKHEPTKIFLKPPIIKKINDSIKFVLDAGHLNSNTDK